MRSDRVFDALHTLRNRYMLCQLASKATRKFHKPNTRIQETMNEVLDKIASSERQTVLSEPEHFVEAQRRAASTPAPPSYLSFARNPLTFLKKPALTPISAAVNQRPLLNLTNST